MSEYIKKEDTIEYLNDLFGEMCHVSFDDVIQSIDSLQTYSFSDSAEDNTMEWVMDGCIEKCSVCGEEMRFPHWTTCPNCGRKAVKK